MILAFHIVVALASMIWSSLLFVRPTRNSFRVTYGLIAATLGSGTYLVWSQPTQHIAQTCLTGLLYIGVVLCGIVFARHKQFVREQISIKRSR